ncbi:MAG: hypothetical protein LV479_06095 [Methylacidiphilales bacterium]|nr:hypothetical protein [Candidatus Methylacidiphilales bacterium]
MRPIFIALFLAAFLNGSVQAANVVADPFPPARFTSLYLERDEGGANIVIQLNGDTVTYTKTVKGQVVETKTVQPAGDDWFQFIQGLNQAKVYKWAPHYEYPGQGVTWVIELAMPDRKFSSDGMNEFPKENAEDQPQADPNAGPSVPFQFFWQAALGLVGKAAATAK